MTASKTILCAVDLSHGSERVVAQAAELAQAMSATLELLHVYRVPLIPLEEGDGETSEEELERLLARVEQELARLAEPARALGVQVHTVLLEGGASESILRQSERSGASLVVVGTHGHSGLKHLVLGSTAERVVRQSRTPVVTVRVGD
jgi:nucleotide-binding universal stress UspA family protein